MGSLLSICYEARRNDGTDAHIIYAPYCNACNRRIYDQVTLKEGKYLSFFCSEECKSKYMAGKRATQYSAQGEDPTFRPSLPFATPARSHGYAPPTGNR